MGILDSDSDDESSVSSVEEVAKGKVDVTRFVNKKKASLDDYEAFKGANDEDDEVAAKMKEMLQLREALGMDKDVNFLAQQAAKEQEQKRLASMSQEERMKHDASNAGDMMARIRAKQEALSKKKQEEEALAAEEAATEEIASSNEVKKKKKEKKEKKKKKSDD